MTVIVRPVLRKRIKELIDRPCVSLDVTGDVVRFIDPSGHVLNTVKLDHWARLLLFERLKQDDVTQSNAARFARDFIQYLTVTVPRPQSEKM